MGLPEGFQLHGPGFDVQDEPVEVLFVFEELPLHPVRQAPGQLEVELGQSPVRLGQAALTRPPLGGRPAGGGSQVSLGVPASRRGKESQQGVRGWVALDGQYLGVLLVGAVAGDLLVEVLSRLLCLPPGPLQLLNQLVGGGRLGLLEETGGVVESELGDGPIEGITV